MTPLRKSPQNTKPDVFARSRGTSQRSSGETREEENETQHNAVEQNKYNEKQIRKWLSMSPKKPAAIAWSTIRQAGGTGYPLAHPSVRGSREQQGRPVVQEPKQSHKPDHSPSLGTLASMTG